MARSKAPWIGVVGCFALSACAGAGPPHKPIVEPQGGTIAPVSTPPGAFISMTGYCYDAQTDYAYRSNFCAKGDRIITAEEFTGHAARGRSITAGAQ